MLPISLIIHTKNSEDTLQRAVDSASAYVSEVIVVDMQSSDSTRTLAKQLGARVISVPNADYADPARQTGIDSARHEWIFMLDADEVASPLLFDAVKPHLNDPQISGIELPRKNMIFDTWAKTGWWPDYICRIFRKDKTFWPSGLHSKPVVTGTVIQLPANPSIAILHHHYDSVDQYLNRMNRYTSIKAREFEGRPEEGMITYASQEFFRRYFFHKGYAQNTYGMILSTLQAISHTVEWIKIWERNKDEMLISEETVEHEIDEMFRHMAYWFADRKVDKSTNFFDRLYWKIRRKLQL